MQIREEYQVTDKQGNAIGPKQVAIGEGPDEVSALKDLTAKLKSMHQNSSAKLYEVKLANKLGTMMEPDPDQPILTYEEKPLTADELVRVQNLLKDPKTAPEAYRLLLEAQFGAPVEKIRQTLRDTEINNRVEFMRQEVERFKLAHPEYVECKSNQDAMNGYILKNNWALTVKSLEKAFEDLSAEGLLVVQVKEADPEIPAPAPASEAIPASSPAEAPAIPPVQDIPVPPTPPAPISAEATETRPAVAPPSSSSGLSRANASVSGPPAPPKAKGITRAEIAQMDSKTYGERLRTDPLFAKAVDEMLKREG